MSLAPADRLLEVLAEPVAIVIIRALAHSERTQAALVEELELGQSVVSRSSKTLRAAGILESDTPRGPLRLRAPEEMRTLLSAVDRFAEALLANDLARQDVASAQTRRSRIRPATATAAATRRPTA
jgi:DNA-binding transcriptional ArsR family regulator